MSTLISLDAGVVLFLPCHCCLSLACQLGLRLFTMYFSPCSYWSVVNHSQTPQIHSTAEMATAGATHNELHVRLFRNLWVVFVCMLYTSGPISRPTALLLHKIICAICVACTIIIVKQTPTSSTPGIWSRMAAHLLRSLLTPQQTNKYKLIN